MSYSPKRWRSRRGQFWPRVSTGTVPPRRSPRRPGLTLSYLHCPASVVPYAGKLGVVEQGALADLLVVDGNPLENINLIADPAKNFKVIMKDGRVYKNVP